MKISLDGSVLKAIAARTLKGYLETPSAYVVGVFFYGFVGWFFGSNYFVSNQASVEPLAQIAPWVLWFVVPALTMNLVSDEIRTGTFEHLATLPVRDWEIVLGKYAGFVAFYGLLVAGLILFPLTVAVTVNHPLGLDGGQAFGVLLGLFFLGAFYGAVGLWASSLAKNQVVVLIVGMLLCTVFFFLGQIVQMMPAPLSVILDYLGVSSHLANLAKGVMDFRDLFYFGSFGAFFLYLTSVRLATRRF